MAWLDDIAENCVDIASSEIVKEVDIIEVIITTGVVAAKWILYEMPSPL